MTPRIVSCTALVSLLFPLLLADAAGAQSCTPSPSGLLYWWPGNGDAFDVEGGKHGTLVNGAAFAPGLVGQGFSFDGVNDFVSLPGCLGGGPEVTVEAWFKTTGTNPSDFYAVVSTSAQAFEFVHLQLFHIGNITVYTNTGTINLPVVPQTPTGVFRHIALSAKSGDTRLYVDGNLFGSSSKTFSFIVPTHNPRIGSGYAGVRFFKGVIDEVSIYNRALTAAEIQAIYQAGAPGKCPPSSVCVAPPSGAISWWAGDGDATDQQGTSGGILGNGATFGPGKVDQAFSLDGVNDYVLVPNVGGAYDFGAGASFSWEAWFQTSASGTIQTIVSKEDGNRPTFNSLVLANGSAQCALQPNQGVLTYSVTSLGCYNDGAFHHIVGIANGAASTLTMVVDGGAEIRTIAFPAGSTFVEAPTALLIGARIPVAPDRFFKGKIDEPTLYGRALSVAEVVAIFEAGSAGKCKMPPDVDSPFVTIDSPQDGAIVGAATVTLTATVNDETATTVSSAPPGISASFPAGGGTVSGTVALAEGSNPLSVTAEDEAHNVGGTSVTVIRDTIAPGVTIVSPPDNAVFGDSLVALTVSVSDATATTVSFGANSIALPAGGGTATGDVDLVEGANTIVVSVTDAAGNPASETLHVVLDLTAPLVMIDSPADGSCFGSGDSPIAVVATVDDLTATTVDSIPNGVSASFGAGGGIVTGVIAIAEGSNTLTVSATDAVGRLGSASISVVLDTTPPELAIDSPSVDAAVRGTIDFDASAMDVAPGSGVARIDFSVDGNLLASLTTAPYETTLDTTTLLDGFHSLEALAVDGKGNSCSVSVNVRVDNTPPSVAILAPSNAAYVAGSVAFDVAASDGGSGLASIQMLAGGVAPTNDSSTAYLLPVASDLRAGSEGTTRWPDGPLSFTALARDAAGNEALASVTITVDNTLPAKSLISPTDGSVVSGVVAILADAQDPNLDTLEILVDGVSQGASSSTPFGVSFDTRTRLDGALSVTVIARDLAGNTSTCTATVTVDNVSVLIDPRTLNLKSKGKDNSVTCNLEGASLSLLMPTEAHAIELRVPGGNPVPSSAGFSGDDALSDPDLDGVPNLVIKFDRQKLIASIQAGIAGGFILPDSNVTLTLVAQGGFVIGTDSMRINNR